MFCSLSLLCRREINGAIVAGYSWSFVDSLFCLMSLENHHLSQTPICVSDSHLRPAMPNFRIFSSRHTQFYHDIPPICLTKLLHSQHPTSVGYQQLQPQSILFHPTTKPYATTLAENLHRSNNHLCEGCLPISARFWVAGSIYHYNWGESVA